jgi:methyltransferase (TIGR00027 family)
MTMDRRRFLSSIPALGLAPIPVSRAYALAGEPSRTAQSTAAHRAAHQLLDWPRVFDDSVATKILGAARAKWIESNLKQFETPGSRAMRAFLVTRARDAEDELARAHEDGTRQYMILGAGLDTFAYRNALHGLRVFEVDHPASQAWKRAQLRDTGIALPASLRFVSVDFERDSLAGRLHSAGFRYDEPVFISWLGVTMYLTEEAVMQTLRFVASSCAPGSEIVFDFSLPDHALTAAERTSRAARAKRVAAIGEPWISYFDAAALEDELDAMGFSEASSFGAAEANARYFRNRTDAFRFRGSARIMTARV